MSEDNPVSSISEEDNSVVQDVSLEEREVALREREITLKEIETKFRLGLERITGYPFTR